MASTFARSAGFTNSGTSTAPRTDSMWLAARGEGRAGQESVRGVSREAKLLQKFFSFLFFSIFPSFMVCTAQWHQHHWCSNIQRSNTVAGECLDVDAWGLPSASLVLPRMSMSAGSVWVRRGARVDNGDAAAPPLGIFGMLLLLPLTARSHTMVPVSRNAATSTHPRDTGTVECCDVIEWLVTVRKQLMGAPCPITNTYNH